MPSESGDGRCLVTGEVLSQAVERKWEVEGCMGVSQFPFAMSVGHRRATVSSGYENKTGIRGKREEERG